MPLPAVASGALRSGLLTKALDKLRGGGKYFWDLMWGNKIPKWTLPVFGATVAAPIIAHELDPEAKQMMIDDKHAALRKRAQLAVHTALYGKAAQVAQVERLDGLKQHLLKAKRRPAKKEEGTPSMRFRYGGKTPA